MQVINYSKVKSLLVDEIFLKIVIILIPIIMMIMIIRVPNNNSKDNNTFNSFREKLIKHAVFK